MSEATVWSREEEDVLQQSTKKVKESHRDLANHKLLHSNFDAEGRSYRDRLVGMCLGAFEKAFDFENTMETEVVTDNEAEEDCPGEATVRLTSNKKSKIRAAWKDALIVKVFGKTVGFSYLTAC